MPARDGAVPMDEALLEALRPIITLVVVGPAARSGRAAVSIMPKLALKMLLTGLTLRRGSRRTDGVQLAAALLTLTVIVLAGLYIWSHGPY
jgi:hypothetical protein